MQNWTVGTLAGLCLLFASTARVAAEDGQDSAADDAPIPTTAESAPVEPAAAADSGEITTIVVTGSRIKQKADFVNSNPVVSVGAEAISNAGVTNVADFLSEIPALTGSISSNAAGGSNAFIGGTGLELLNLRNLGVDRTLVLVNGRRHVAGLPGSAAVDVDTIPIGLIEDIQVLTGGASAIYGADGVSGVVNFVMKKDFEGLDFKTQFGRSSHGDGNGFLASLVGGQNFGGGRGNISAALEYTSEDRIRSTDRSYSSRKGRVSFVTNPNAGPGQPDRVPLHNIRYADTSRDGGVDVDFDFSYPDYNGRDLPWDAGTIPRPDPYTAPISPFYQQGGDGTYTADYIGDLTPEQERYTFNTFLNYQLFDQARLFAELKYSRNNAFTRSQPTFDYYLWIEPDNAYTPPNIAAAAQQADALYDTGGVLLVGRDNFDLGVRGEDIQRDTYRSVLGLDGDIWSGTHYEVSVVYGETDVRNNSLNNRYNDRFSAALDAVIDPATNTPTCRSNLDPNAAPFNLEWQQTLFGETGYYNQFQPRSGTWAGSFDPGPNSGCVPLNIFGDGSVSSAARNWVMTNSLDTSRITQTVVQAVLSGDTVNWFVPGGSPMGYVIGYERRLETSEGHPAYEDQRGFTFGNIIQPEKGDYAVSEVFLELRLPILEGKPYAEYLGVDTAYRLSSYNTIGSTKTWKLGGSWRVVEDVTFRGTRAKATRAPNISELFDPGGQTFEFIDDPCDASRVNSGTQYRQGNCSALLSGLGVADPSTYTDPNSASIAGTLRGNSKLDEEDATTSTLGVVLEPRFTPGLSLAVDYYSIKLENAINTATPQEAADNCVDSPSLNNQFCSLLLRQTGTGGIVGFVQLPVNVAQFSTKGYDLTMNYRLKPADLGVTRDIGLFNFRLIGNKLQKLVFINLPGAVPDHDEGEGPRENGGQAPKWQANFDMTWKYQRLAINYGVNYFDKTQRYTTRERSGNPNIVDSRYFDYAAKLTQDIYASFAVLDKLSLYAGINNFTNQQPDIGEVAYPVSPVGRFFYAGLQVSGF